MEFWSFLKCLLNTGMPRTESFSRRKGFGDLYGSYRTTWNQGTEMTAIKMIVHCFSVIDVPSMEERYGTVQSGNLRSQHGKTSCS